MSVHLYGVARSGTPLPAQSGRQGGELRLVADDELGVIVSDVDEHRRVGAADLLAHARVLEAVAAETTLVPMRFGIMLPTDEEVRTEVLVHDRPRISQQLDDLDGTVQFSVRVFLEEEPALRTVLSRAPELLALRDQLRETSPPASSSAQVHLGERVSAGVQDLAASYALALADRLAASAARVYSVEPAASLEVLNCAYLVERDRQEELDKAVGSLRREYAGILSIRYVGPQPPYCFVVS